MTDKPLTGVRVLELGQLLSGPFASTLLGWFGAEVIKVEPLSGDPIRSWRKLDEDGTSLWWRTLSRNKRSIAMDLHDERGQGICRELMGRADVVIENFRPGRMEEWNLGPEKFEVAHPGLVYCRVSGFGQTGPYRDRPGYASVCEAMAGLRYLTGMPGDTPIRTNLSLGDSIAGLHAAFGVMLALRHRDKTGLGQVVDVALTESILNLLESVLVEHSFDGTVREPSGTGLTGIVPSNAYPTKDGADIVIGANGESVFSRLMTTMGRPDLADAPELRGNPGRVAAQSRIDEAIGNYCAQLTAAEITEALVANNVPVGPIYTAKAISEDAHFRSRGWFEQHRVGEQDLEIPSLAPRLLRTPGRTTSLGPRLGEHTDEVLRSLGKSEEQVAALRNDGVAL